MQRNTNLNVFVSQIGAAVIELVLSTAAFWSATGKAYRQTHPRLREANTSIVKEVLFKSPAARVTWLCALYLFCYVGVEVALGGWIVTFMMRVRQSSAFPSGMTATGFWSGLTVGRFVLGFVTPRLGEKLAISVRDQPHINKTLFPKSTTNQYRYICRWP